VQLFVDFKQAFDEELRHSELIREKMEETTHPINHHWLGRKLLKNEQLL
jgi:hypothetical protein